MLRQGIYIRVGIAESATMPTRFLLVAAVASLVLAATAGAAQRFQAPQ